MEANKGKFIQKMAINAGYCPEKTKIKEQIKINEKK